MAIINLEIGPATRSGNTVTPSTTGVSATQGGFVHGIFVGDIQADPNTQAPNITVTFGPTTNRTTYHLIPGRPIPAGTGGTANTDVVISNRNETRFNLLINTA